MKHTRTRVTRIFRILMRSHELSNNYTAELSNNFLSLVQKLFPSCPIISWPSNNLAQFEHAAERHWQALFHGLFRPLTDQQEQAE